MAAYREAIAAIDGPIGELAGRRAAIQDLLEGSRCGYEVAAGVH